MREGTDPGQLLSQHLAAHGPTLQAGDVVVVAQKIVSKAEGCFVDLAGDAPSSTASELAIAVGKDPRLVELVLRESLAVVRTAPNVLIARHRCQRHCKIPQKCRSKIPHFAIFIDQLAWWLAPPFLGGRPRRLGSAMFGRVGSGNKAAWLRSR